MTTFPTLTLAPHISTPTEHSNPAIANEMQNGTTTTRPGYSRVLQNWSLKWPKLPDTDLIILAAFWRTVKGSSASFQWSDEFDNSYTVRFKVGTKLKHQSVSHDSSAVEVELEEV